MNRADFPVLVNHPKLVYLDSANTTLKPKAVIDAVHTYYADCGANIGRATYRLAEQATSAYDAARHQTAQFIGAAPDEIIFTHSTTYALNQAAWGLRSTLKSGDIILLSDHEHNSNIIVWQQLAAQTGARLAYLSDQPPLKNVKILAFTLASNITGQIFDHSKLISDLKKTGAIIVIDAAQAISKMPLNAAQLGADLLAFSAHKLYAPSGVGVLYANLETQARLTPLVYGSQTFAAISRQNTQLLSNFERFEAGTPNIEGALGLAAALKYLNQISMAKVQAHDQALVTYALSQLQKYRLDQYLVGRPRCQVGVLSLNHPRIHPHDFALFLDNANIAVRAGKACSDILMQKLGLGRGVVRLSFGLYTTKSDIDKFIAGYRKTMERLDG